MDVTYDDLEARAKEFCDKIGAKFLYMNGSGFSFKTKAGETQNLYWFELDKVMYDMGMLSETMRRGKEARKNDYEYNKFELSHKIEGPTWSTFLSNLDEAGFAFNDIYYERPHKYIDAFRGDTGYQVKVKSYKYPKYEVYEVDDITEVPMMTESCEDEETQVMTEASNRYTHRIVLGPEGTRYRLTHQDKLRYKSAEDAEKALAELEARIGDRLAAKGLTLEIKEIEQKPRRTGTNDPDYENPFEVGDILFGDVGYSMSIPEWWQVVKVTSKTVTCRRLATDIVEHDGYGQSGTEVPIRGVFNKRGGTVNGVPSDAPVTMRVKKWSGQVASWREEGKGQYYASSGSRYGHIFSLWDGKPKPFDYYD